MAAALAVFGAAAAVILFTPLTGWWAGRMARPWVDARGDLLVVLAGSSLPDGTLGESSYWRSVYAARVFHEGWVQKIIVAGQPAPEMRQFLIASGVPEDRIVIEPASTNTAENARNVAPLLRTLPGRVVVMTSEFHIPRARAQFAAAGLSVAMRPIPDAGKRAVHLEGRWSAFCDLAAESAKLLYITVRGPV